MKYLELIEKARLIRNVDSCLTTGDLDYPGTALEISELEGEELLHVVVDSSGERQVLFFCSEQNFRIPLDLLEKIVTRAKETVRFSVE